MAAREESECTFAVTDTFNQRVVVMRSPYNHHFVEAFKYEVSQSARRWEHNLKVWYLLTPAATLQAIRLARSYYDRVTVSVEVQAYIGYKSHTDDRRPTMPATDSKIDRAYKTLHLLETAPDALIESAYRAMAKLFHPDTGGDTAKMQEINVAYDTIRKARGGRK